MFKSILTTAIVTLAAASAFATTAPDFVIPVAGTGPGANSSQWQTEVTLHNAGADPLLLTIAFHDATGKTGSFDLTLGARETTSVQDIVASKFGKAQATGGLVITTNEVLRQKLAVTSRTFNLSPTGEFGQDIPALGASEALVTGDTAVVNGPSNAAATRFNFGIFTIAPTEVEWTLLRKDGTVAKTVTRSYEEGVQLQYNDGVTALLGETRQDNDVVNAKLLSGTAYVYGSIANNATGDPTFVPSGRTRENLLPVFLGVDLDENGTADIVDANHDGVLDGPVDVPTSGFPSFFRVLAADPEHKSLTYSIANTVTGARIDSNGTVQWFPTSADKGTTGTLVISVSDGTDSADFTIPVNFR